jgi:hypothetical protein
MIKEVFEAHPLIKTAIVDTMCESEKAKKYLDARLKAPM